MIPSPPQIVELGPDDDRFIDWCEVWAASGRADRPDEPPRPVSDHVALGRQLVTSGGSRDGTHRAAVVDGAVVGALRLILPVLDNLTVAIVDVAVHPAHRRRGIGSTLLAEGARLAEATGIILADTKFEFGFIDGELAVIDEVLTPDSSRFWPAEDYAPGANPPSFDKQYVRDFVADAGWNKEPPAPTLPEDVILGTRDRYVAAYERLTGQRWEASA